MKVHKKDCDPSEANDKSLPVNSWIVTYNDGEKTCYDIVVAGKQLDIFDYYWDRYRDDKMSWKYTKGTISAKLWQGQQDASTKKK